MAERMGMVPENVEAGLTQLAGHSHALRTIAHEVNRAGWASQSPSMFGLIPGYNLVMTTGSVLLAQSAAADISAALGSMDELVGRLRGEVTEQLRASSADVGYADPIVSRQDAERLYREAMDDPSVLDDLDALAVKAWWQQLTDGERAALIDEQSLTIGNLDGIPMTARAEANWHTAVRELGNPGLTTDKREYLQRVASGDVILVAYDPAGDRIIEAIGLGVMDFREDPRNPTFVMGAKWGDDGELVAKDPPAHVITYVPGTGSDLATFYTEENYQNFGHGIVLGHEDDSVVFVYKGGPFASDLDEAKDQTFTLGTGRTLASFDAAIDLETGLSQASQVAIGHSWGLANVTASEIAGADYDSVISLAGAWMPDGWEPDPGTQYSHHSYTDWLRAAQIGDRDVVPFDVIGSGNFPGDNPAFDRHVYSSPNDDELIPDNWFSRQEYEEAKDAWVDNHELIHQPLDPANSKASQNIRQDIYG
jgi:hypothetical protein